MKYIDSEKLIAEIERRIKLIPLNFVEVSSSPNAEKTNHKLRNELELALNSIKDLITTLQQEQPEVDLEKEIGRWMDKLDDKYCILVEDYSIQDIKDTARHFYELGQCTKYQQDRAEFAKLKAKEWQSGYDEGYTKGLNARKEE